MSVFETKLRQLMRKARLPQPVLQHSVERPNGRKAFIDFAFPHAKVAIEADSIECHFGFLSWNDDRARRNELEAMGWRVIQISYQDMIERPDDVIVWIRALLYPQLTT
jgi:very-short-patch-repair endonuclease